MPAQNDEIITGSSLPTSVLELLRDPIPSDGDTWKQRFEGANRTTSDHALHDLPDDLSQIEYTSSQFAQWLGYPRDEWTSNPELFVSRLHPDDRDAVLASDDRATETGESFEIEYRLRARDGAWHWVRDSAVLLRNQDGVGIAWQGVTVDITDLKNAEAHQAEARALYRSLVEQVPGVVFRESTGWPSRPLYISPQVEELLGYTVEEWNTTPSIWEVVVHPDDYDRVKQEHMDAGTRTAIHIQYRMITRDGQTIWVREDRELVYDDRGRPHCWQGLLIDITRQKQLEEQLAHQALHDPLTGLPNRTYFGEIVSRALANATGGDNPIALLFLDLDGFKATNDKLGHQVGDQLLTAVARHLPSALRDDDVVARIGGDEFAILLSCPITRERAAKLAGDVLESLRHRFEIGNHEIQCSGSIGIALGDAAADSLTDLLRQADIAMYQAKASGRDRYAVYVPETGEARAEPSADDES
ncbi:MAG: diguanylate cyclase [Thermomicrobiales bacterium]